MTMIRTTLLAAGAVLLLAVPAAGQGDEPTVNGRIVLPDGATLEGAASWTLEVQDTSLADAPAVVVGTDGGPVTDPTATEIPFAAPFDPGAIDEASMYTLSARVVDEAGDLLFINDTAIPVISDGAPVDEVGVPVIAVDSGASEPRVIEIEADAALRFLQGGEQVTEIPVTPGETVLFRVDNTAGFAHNFYIGPDEELMVPSATTEIGLSDWDTGVKEMTWVVPDDLTDVRFACTVPGHYTLMQGDFTIAP